MPGDLQDEQLDQQRKSGKAGAQSGGQQTPRPGAGNDLVLIAILASAYQE